MIENDAMLHLIVDTIPDSICVTDSEGVITLVNAAWKKFSDENGGAAARATGVGTNYFTVCASASGPYAEGAAQVLAGLQAVVNGEQGSFTKTYACMTPSEERWFEIHAIRLPTGPPLQMLIIHRDITNVIRTERALFASEERYRQIMETSGEGVWAMDGMHRTTVINNRMLDMLGYDREDVVGRPVEAFMFPEDLPDHSQRMRERHGGSGGTYEHRFKRRDGSVLSTRVSATSLTTAGGTFGGSFAMFTDITDQKRAELSLVQIQEQLRTFFRHAPVGMGILDGKGHPVSLNPTLTEFAAIPLVAAFQRGHEGVTFLDDPGLKDQIARAVATRETPGEFTITVTGTNHVDSRTFSVSVFPFVTPATPVITIGIIAVETTASVQAAEHIQRSLHEKDTLLKEIHHRVKNNLQVISSLLSMQGKTLSDPTAAMAFEECRHRVRSMALVHERLYGSADLGQIDFGDYARFLVSQLALTYRASNVRIVTQCEHLLFDITMAIPAGLILNELVSNVFKYAFPEGRPGALTLTIRADAGSCTLQVEDDGVGIPPSVSTDQPLTLGLQLVRALAQQLDGTVEFHSTGGTSIRLQFPLSAPE